MMERVADVGSGILLPIMDWAWERYFDSYEWLYFIFIIARMLRCGAIEKQPAMSYKFSENNWTGYSKDG